MYNPPTYQNDKNLVLFVDCLCSPARSMRAYVKQRERQFLEVAHTLNVENFVRRFRSSTTRSCLHPHTQNPREHVAPPYNTCTSKCIGFAMCRFVALCRFVAHTITRSSAASLHVLRTKFVFCTFLVRIHNQHPTNYQVGYTK